MNKKAILDRISALYEKNNINILEYLNSLSDGNAGRSVEDILISYDFQAGSYVKGYEADPEWKNHFVQRLADTIDSLDCGKYSILECGVGEATTLVPLLNHLECTFENAYGIDISWSRVKAGTEFAEKWGGTMSG